MLSKYCVPIPQGIMVSHRAFWGRFFIFTKKVVRKILKPYHRFIFQRQMKFNTIITNVFPKIEDLFQDLIEKYEELHQENILQKRRLELVLTELENKLKLDEDSTEKLLG